MPSAGSPLRLSVKGSEHAWSKGMSQTYLTVEFPNSSLPSYSPAPRPPPPKEHDGTNSL